MEKCTQRSTSNNCENCHLVELQSTVNIATKPLIERNCLCDTDSIF